MYGLLPLSGLLTMSTFVNMMVIEFPPNPEDGELWLPSDIFSEIESPKRPPPHSTNHQPLPYSTNHRPLPYSTNHQPLHADRLKKPPKGDANSSRRNPSFKLHEGRGGSANVTLMDYWPPHKNHYRKNFAREEGRRGGTGVFLPYRNHHISRHSSADPIKLTSRSFGTDTGTGVFISHQVQQQPGQPSPQTHRRNKSFGVSGVSNKKSGKEKNGDAGGKLAHSKSEIHLPDDWVY